MKNKIQIMFVRGLQKALNHDNGLGLPRHWKVIASTLLLLFTFAVGNVWADTYADVYTNPASGSGLAGNANGKGAFSAITCGTGTSFGNSSLQIGTSGGSGTFTVASIDGSYITSIAFTSQSNYPINTLTSDDGTIVESDGVYTFTPTSSTLTSASFSMTAKSGKKVRVAPITVNLTSDHSYLSMNFGVSSGTVSCTKSSGAADLVVTTTGSASSNRLSFGSGKTLTFTSEEHNIAAIHFTCVGHADLSSVTASSGTISGSSWTPESDVKTVTFSSNSSNTIGAISVKLTAAAPIAKHHVTYALGTGASGTTPTQADVAEGAKFTLHNGTTGITAPTGKQFAGWNDGTTTYAGGAEYTMGTDDVELTAQWENTKTDPTATFSAGAYVVGESALDLSTLWSSNSDGAVTYALKEASDDAEVSGSSFTATKAGSYVVTASQAATSTYNAIEKEATITVTWPATGAATITYNLDVTNKGTTLQTLNTTNATSSSISVAASNSLLFGGLGKSSDKGSHNGARTLGINTLAEETADKYFGVTFTVADGKMFTPSAISLKVLTIGGNATSYKAVLTDGTNSIVGTVDATNDSEKTLGSWSGLGTTTLTGDVTLKLYAWYTTSGSYNAYRLSTPITIAGTVAAIPSSSAPVISAPDADQDAVYDLNDVIAPLEITASGYPTPTYQWYKNSSASTEGATAIDGAESASYTPANDVASDLYYYCVATNSQGSATSHYFHVAVNAPTVPTIYTETTALTLTSTTVLTASETFTFSGLNLGETAVTLVLASAVDGLTLSEASVAPTAGAITDKEITVSYKSLLDVTPADVNLYLKQGDNILHTIALTYSSTAGIEDLTSISAATTWNWDGAADAAFGTLDQNAMIVLANADVTWDAGFNALAIAGKLQHYYRDSKYAQGHELKFNTTVPGRVTVTFSNTSNKTVARAPRITDVNGSYAPTDEADGAKTADAKSYSHAVAAGDVLIAGFEMQEGTPANMLRYYKVEFVPTYTVAYAAGEHGSGTMTDANAYIAGEEVTLLPNTFAPESGYVWSGWVVTKTASGDPIEVSEGKFTMPAEAVTVTAQWEDNSKVAKIGDNKYTSLEEALEHAADGTIELLQDIDVTAQVEVLSGVTATIDLAGYKIEYTGTSTLPSGVILVHNGASLTIDDSSDPDAGSIVSGNQAYAAVALTKAGDDAANPAILTVNGGTLSGYYYGITGNGSRHNTVTTINGGTIIGTCTGDNLGIYHPQNGTLTINGGTITAYSAAVEMRAGELEINGGTFTATAPTFSCNPNGSGTTTVGAAIAIAQHTTKVDIAVTINGGEFNGVKALNESNPQVNDPAPQVDLAVTGGDFTGEVSTVDVDHFISGGSFDAPVPNENCAEGFVPSPLNPVTGKYSVEPKDGVSIIKVATTGGTNKTVTGLYAGEGDVNLSSNTKMDNGKYIGFTLDGTTLQAGDRINVHTTEAANTGGSHIIFYDNMTNKTELYETGEIGGTGDNIFEINAAMVGSATAYVYRANNDAAHQWNGKVDFIEVTRAMNPVLSAITIDGRDGVIDEANKTVAVQIPHEAVLSSLTVVPTIIRNAAHATTPEAVISNEGAWIEGDNTYRVMDKDGDYTDYIITLTRDVQKHTVSFNVHGGSAVASEEVVHGEYLAAAPAAPTKDENVFKFWSETEDGAEVDVTTVQINADKEFHAVWEAEPAGIKLFNGNVLNTTNFISAAATTIEISEVEYPCLVAFNSNRTSLAGAKQGDLVLYNATTDAAKIKFDLYNANGSAKKAYVWLVEEGDAAATQLDEIEIAGETRVKTAYYEFNGTKNRTVYLTSGSKTDIKVLQAKVIESGSAIKQFGQAGYSLNLNKGRLATVADVAVPFEGATLTVSSEYSVLNSSNLATKSANSFNVASPVIMHVERSGGKYYVYQDPENKGTLYSANADIELNTTGTWYISSETASSAASFTLIRFDLPKCDKPTVVDLANVELCAGEPYTELTVSATKSDEGTLHYAWFKEAGETDEAVGDDAASFTPGADGEYYVIVTNTLAGHQDNAATSNTISVAHFASVAITTAPEDVYKHTGLDATLSVVATGKNLTYEWFTCDDELGTNPVAIVPAETAADLNLTAIESGIKYYQVVVTDECGTSESAVAKVEGFDDLPLQDVTGNMTWDFSKANDGTAAGSNLCTEKVLVNVAGIVNNSDFKSDNIMATANKFASGKLQASMIKFHTTVDGMITVVFSNTGTKSSDRYLTVNGRKTDKGSRNGTAVTYTGFVYAGDVELGVVEGDGNMLNFTSVDFKATVDYPRTGLNPNNIGTLCWTNNAILGGATLYELAGKNENNYLVFDEVKENRLEAGKPYIFVPENGNTEIKVYNTDNEAKTAPVDPETGMMGTFSDLNSANGDLMGNYVISNNHYIYVNSGNVTLKKYRAYITSLDDVAPMNQQEAPAPGRRRIVMGGQNQMPTGIDAINASEKPMKIMIDGQIYILRGEKMFDATGRLVK